MSAKTMVRTMAAALALGLALPLHAEDNAVEKRLLASLTAQGYTILEDGYTWLGRLRIVAENGVLHREIVVNPGTGEVLRDYAVRIGPRSAATVASGGGSHGGSGPAGAAPPDDGAKTEDVPADAPEMLPPVLEN